MTCSHTRRFISISIHKYPVPVILTGIAPIGIRNIYFEVWKISDFKWTVFRFVSLQKIFFGFRFKIILWKSNSTPSDLFYRNVQHTYKCSIWEETDKRLATRSILDMKKEYMNIWTYSVLTSEQELCNDKLIDFMPSEELLLSKYVWRWYYCSISLTTFLNIVEWPKHLWWRQHIHFSVTLVEQ